MGRKPTGVRKRILKASTELFYIQGYSNTGISQIVEQANTTKSSLYQYFNSKKKLGYEYLKNYNQLLLKRVIRIMRKSTTPEEFVERWILGIKRSIQINKNYNGCPIAGFHFQLEMTENENKEYIKRLANRWILVLGIYFSMKNEKGHNNSSHDSQQVARMIFSTYEGMLTLWKFTKNESVLDDAMILMKKVLN